MNDKCKLCVRICIFLLISVLCMRASPHLKLCYLFVLSVMYPMRLNFSRSLYNNFRFCSIFKFLLNFWFISVNTYYHPALFTWCFVCDVFDSCHFILYFYAKRQCISQVDRKYCVKLYWCKLINILWKCRQRYLSCYFQLALIYYLRNIPTYIHVCLLHLICLYACGVYWCKYYYSIKFIKYFSNNIENYSYYISQNCNKFQI